MADAEAYNQNKEKWYLLLRILFQIKDCIFRRKWFLASFLISTTGKCEPETAEDIMAEMRNRTNYNPISLTVMQVEPEGQNNPITAWFIFSSSHPRV